MEKKEYVFWKDYFGDQERLGLGNLIGKILEAMFYY